MLKPGVSYLDAFLKNNNDVSLLYTFDSYSIKKPIQFKLIKKCKICFNLYNYDKNDLKISYCKIIKKNAPKTQLCPITYTEKEKHENFICRSCTQSLIICNMCGNKFEKKFITKAFDDSSLQEKVDVCIKCYEHEACTGCSYLAGASPCKWCRSIM